MAKKEKQSIGIETELKQKLVIVVTNRGFSEDVVEKSRISGATGATILHGRGTAGIGETFLGMNVTPEKEVVMIVVGETIVHDVIQRISETLASNTAAGGICFCLPVNHMTKKIINDNKDTETKD